MTQASSRPPKTPEIREAARRSPEIRIERTIENQPDEAKRFSVKSRLSSTIGAVVTNEGNYISIMEHAHRFYITYLKHICIVT